MDEKAAALFGRARNSAAACLSYMVRTSSRIPGEACARPPAAKEVGFTGENADGVAFDAVHHMLLCPGGCLVVEKKDHGAIRGLVVFVSRMFNYETTTALRGPRKPFPWNARHQNIPLSQVKRESANMEREDWDSVIIRIS